MRNAFKKYFVFLHQAHRTSATTLKVGARLKGNERERKMLKKWAKGKQKTANHAMEEQYPIRRTLYGSSLVILFIFQELMPK